MKEAILMLAAVSSGMTVFYFLPKLLASKGIDCLA